MFEHLHPSRTASVQSQEWPPNRAASMLRPKTF
jgi:hypothetical protein